MKNSIKKIVTTILYCIGLLCGSSSINAMLVIKKHAPVVTHAVTHSDENATPETPPEKSRSMFTTRDLFNLEHEKLEGKEIHPQTIALDILKTSNHKVLGSLDPNKHHDEDKHAVLPLEESCDQFRDPYEQLVLIGNSDKTDSEIIFAIYKLLQSSRFTGLEIAKARKEIINSHAIVFLGIVHRLFYSKHDSATDIEIYNDILKEIKRSHQLRFIFPKLVPYVARLADFYKKIELVHHINTCQLGRFINNGYHDHTTDISRFGVATDSELENLIKKVVQREEKLATAIKITGS